MEKSHYKCYSDKKEGLTGFIAEQMDSIRYCATAFEKVVEVRTPIVNQNYIVKQMDVFDDKEAAKIIAESRVDIAQIKEDGKLDQLYFDAKKRLIMGSDTASSAQRTTAKKNKRPKVK